MPKLRNSITDVGAFTQWIARKCRNHHPLAELKLDRTKRAEVANIYAAKSKGNLFVLEQDQTCVVYRAEDRVFRIDVKEITDITEIEMLLDKPMVAVGN